MSSSQQRRLYLSPEHHRPSSSSALVDETEEDDQDGQQNQDPYNKPELLHPLHYPTAHYHLTGSELQEQDKQQYAYDSMSTILEVDSEASDESAEMRLDQQRRLYDSPLMVRTQPTPEPTRSGHSMPPPDEGGRVSPVGQEKFSGTLNALAQQVERLRRSSTGSQNARPAEQATATSGHAEQYTSQPKPQDGPSSASGSNASTTRGGSGDSDSSSSSNGLGGNTDSHERASSRGSPLAQVEQTASSGPIRPDSRAGSAESLMMISVSPMASPRIKFPLLRRPRRGSNLIVSDDDDDDDDSGERRLVEVSNKSTITAIDLALMDKMVQKYFVNTSEKATQSIKFDCDEHELLDTGLGRPNARNRRPSSKSVAVGTETFSRERFSLLPPTTTRSTQTKPNMDDNDIGTSETRRYKLSHQLFGPVIRRKGAMRDASTEPAESLAQSEQPPAHKPAGSIATSAISSSAQMDSVAQSNTLEAQKELERGNEKESDNKTNSATNKRLKTPTASPKQIEPNRRATQQTASPQPGPSTPPSSASPPPVAHHSREDEGRKRLNSRGVPEDSSPIGRKLTPVSPEVSPLKTQLTKGRLTPTRQVQSASPETDSLVGSPDMIREKPNKSSATSRSSEKPPQSSDSLSSSQEQVVVVATPVTATTMTNTKPADDSASTSQETSSEEASSGSQSDSLLQQPADGKASSTTRPVEPPKSPTGSAALSKQSRATIPSLKTELRVIIEFNDSRQRRRSEVTSNSQFIDGKLSKKTEVSTSKQVVASPREVFNKLQSIGRQHSLLYQQGGPEGRAATATPPAAVAAANQNALRSLSVPSLTSRLQQEPTTGNGTTEWREVSRSSVRNEIETDTRSKRNRAGSRHRQKQVNEEPIDEDIVMTSDATINHLANDKSAIELRSRAVKRRESLERDPRTGRMVRSGRVNERTLVESEAGFDENETEKQQQRQPEVVHRHHQYQPSKPARATIDLQPSSGLGRRQEQASPVARAPREQASPSPAATPQQAPQPTVNAHYHPSQAGPSSTLSSRLHPPPASTASPPIFRATRLEIDEHREDRRQVTKNGQVIFDDRLRERKYETQRGVSPASEQQRQQQWAWQQTPTPTPLTPTMLQFQRGAPHRPSAQTPTGRSVSVSPGSPLSPTGILRTNRTQHQPQLLKPISLFATPTADQAPLLFADQTSNLSSDPETMDSGFAQSGVGSGSALNQAHRQHQQQALSGRSPAPGAINYRQQSQQPQQRRAPDMVNGGPSSPQMQLEHRKAQRLKVEEEEADGLEQPESLNFVDDDVDELINQLDSSRMLSPAQQLSRQTTTTTRRRGAEADEPSKTTPASLSCQAASTSQARPPDAAAGSGGGRFLISPPPAFCSSEPAALNKVDWRKEKRKSMPAATAPRGSLPANQDTALTTKLTRSRRQREEVSGQAEGPKTGSANSRGPKRTLTRLEQNLVTPEHLVGDSGKLQAKSSLANQPADQAKLCRFKAHVMFESDTDSMSTERHSVASSRGPKELVSETKFSRGPPSDGRPNAAAGGEAQPGQAQITAGHPNWDYSLRVNRMRGDRVDSKVNTYIKHSRQPLINSEAS